MTIRVRIWLIPAAAIIIFAAGIGITYMISSSTHSLLQKTSTDNYPLLQKTQALSALLAGIQENLKNAVETNESNNIKLARQKADDFRKHAGEIEQIPDGSEAAKRIKTRFDSYYPAADESAEIMIGLKKGDPAAAIQKMIPALKELTATLAEANKDAAARFEDGLNTSRNNLKTTLIVNVAVLLTTISVLGVISYLLIASITAKLSEILLKVQDASGNADLTKRVNINSTDEFGLIAKGTNKFIDTLHNLVSEVSLVVRHVSDISSKSENTNKDVAVRAAKQTSEAGNIASAAEQMSVTINNMTQNMSGMGQAATVAYQTASESALTINVNIEGIRSIADFVGNAAGMIKALGISTGKIRDVALVINDIAEQTNILALNAAIEAARAGDNGRGFAVVAEEVKKLADRTGKATKEIAKMVQTIQDENRKTVVYIEDGSKETIKNANSINEVQNALETILRDINGIKDTIVQVSSASDELYKAAEDIANNTRQILASATDVSEKTSYATEQGMELNSAVDKLSQLVNRFKILPCSK